VVVVRFDLMSHEYEPTLVVNSASKKKKLFAWFLWRKLYWLWVYFLPFHGSFDLWFIFHCRNVPEPLLGTNPKPLGSIFLLVYGYAKVVARYVGDGVDEGKVRSS
jgi:hypothetical protein